MYSKRKHFISVYNKTCSSWSDKTSWRMNAVLISKIARHVLLRHSYQSALTSFFGYIFFFVNWSFFHKTYDQDMLREFLNKYYPNLLRTFDCCSKIPSDSLQRFGFVVKEFSELEHTVESLPLVGLMGTVFKILHNRQSKIVSVRSTKIFIGISSRSISDIFQKYFSAAVKRSRGFFKRVDSPCPNTNIFLSVEKCAEQVRVWEIYSFTFFSD